MAIFSSRPLRHGLALLLALGASTTAAATTYSVSPSGNDANSGTAASPFRQIRKAIAVASPGDTVLVADGSYLGFDLVSMAGTSSAVFTIKAAGSNASVVPTTDRSDNRDTIFVSFCSYVVIDGLRSSNANRAAVRVDQSDHVTVRNGTFGNDATWGIFTDFSDDLLLENNECFGSVSQHGIYVSNSGDRPTVRGNRVHDNYASGIQLNADASQGGDGIISGAVVEDNIVWNNGAGGGGAINLDGVQDSIIRNNLLYGNHASGITNFQIDGAAGPSGMQIVNNTIDMASDSRWALLFKSSAGGNFVRNNILSNRNPNHGGIDYGDATDIADTDSDYNIMDAVSPDDSTRVTLASWQSQGHEPHSFSAALATLFVNPAAADYHLLAGSPAIDAGQTVASCPADIVGQARPVGPAFDIGCYEFVPSNPGSSFYALPPCRLADTRNGAGPLGGPALAAGAARTFIAAGTCGIPLTAKALSLNVTVTQASGGGNLKFSPDGTAPSTGVTISYGAAGTRANNTLAGLGPSGGIAVQCDQSAGTAHLILDVNGYFQ